MSKKEIGLYIHIPFCKVKCHYCDFNSYPSKEKYISQYIEALEREIVIYKERIEDVEIKSIFIGGGTPSLLPGKDIAGLLQKVGSSMNIMTNAETTLECNPGTLDATKLEEYRKAGVNRLSIGLQAWQNRLLDSLGRIHNNTDFVDNYKASRTAGFSTINIDLIFGIPGQSQTEWEETLDKVVELEPEHLSCYSLKIEEGTHFGNMYEKGELIPVEDEADRKSVV